METVIFLNFDGVINDRFHASTPENVLALESLFYRFQAKPVLITSWQGDGNSTTRNRIRHFFKETFQYPFEEIEFIDPSFTTDLPALPYPERPLGILDYLKKHPDIYYVVLDDEYDEDYAFLNIHHYHPNEEVGL